jgi:DNA-binding beta-propeller fold protein YncE
MMEPVMSRRTGLIAVLVALASVLALLVFGPGRALPEAHGGIVRIDVEGGPPQQIAFGEGAAWVLVGGIATAPATPDFLVWRIDANTDAADPLPATRGANWVAVGEGAAWVSVCRKQGEHGMCTDAALLKLDPDSGATVAEIPILGYPLEVSIASGAVWVTVQHGANQELLVVDPESASVTHRFPENGDEVIDSGGSVWLLGANPGHIARIDPETGAVLDETGVKDACTLSTSGDVLWVATCGLDDRLVRIDPRSGAIIGQNPRAFGSLLWDGHWMRVVSYRDSGSTFAVSRIDPADGHVIGIGYGQMGEQQRFGYRGFGSPNVFAALGDGSLWISDFEAGQVIRVLPGRF